MTITAGTYALDPTHTTIGFVARHAMITKVRGNFTATTFDVNEQGEGTVTGDLTIKDTTKSVDFKVEEAGVAEDPFGNTRLGFEAKTSINRTDFGIDFNAPLKTGGVLVSEEIKIELEVSAIKQ
ncbi:YceI family protein [Corynebacterium minutissimum]|uniref:Metabolite transport protein yceI n=1 Tax=Corynebacterium minutissimum TaxID=38301 RepID=A0A376CR19_9CORY|nr:YceI family protein [Corynebacterium minutissimum]QRP62042.1 YceI family protein [Corynebacterium minutissimum]STC73247.1 Metabolite transport protein yceI [Corynebacterium minutissimum]